MKIYCVVHQEKASFIGGFLLAWPELPLCSWRATVNGTCGDRTHSSAQLYSTPYRGFRNKEWGTQKKQQEHTKTQVWKWAHLHSHHTNKRRGSYCPFACNQQTCSLQHLQHEKPPKLDTFSTFGPLSKDYTDRHAPTLHEWSTFQAKTMKYEMEHYRLEWQSARDCAGPLSHCLLLPEREKKGRDRRERNS